MADVLLDDVLNSLKRMSNTVRQLAKDIDDVISKINVALDQRTLDEYE